MAGRDSEAAAPHATPLTSPLLAGRPQGGDDGIRGEAQGELHRQLSQVPVPAATCCPSAPCVPLRRGVRDPLASDAYLG